MEIDERKIKILRAIISDYINTGEPVGSRTIARKYDLGISSATIRNEMSDLEDMGYLEHIHASSGRKPSNKGYRLYVDKLMKLKGVSKEEEILIKDMLINAALFEVDKVLKQTSLLLSRLTKLTCVVKAPSVKKSSIKKIQLINVDANNVLLIIVTDSGLIKNNMIRINRALDNRALMSISNMLTERLMDLTIEDINLAVINSIKSGLKGYDEIFNAIIPVLYESLNPKDNDEVYMEGEANMLQYQEYNDIERAREFLEFLDDKQSLSKILNTPLDTQVSIGEENYVPQAKDYSVISKAYSIGKKPMGTVGIIGPTRMDYSKVISILNKVIDMLNENLNNYDDW
ncbi:heat-inducible transcriptional repressor HrcA [Clostridium oryzae]|uniref:Heat-inducible transcription repressor HrcA n=1 Tax=Clostridium oryzae TaxID=1450648 RepID=A0A1V4IVI7_9CLOT|nr:heat-inducible transcriptional repressor HrcA [Clostridium oryzae]OPJ63840.1 heat-inducible transcription repressor HrcA [Clostridium oryzae]